MRIPGGTAHSVYPASTTSTYMPIFRDPLQANGRYRVDPYSFSTVHTRFQTLESVQSTLYPFISFIASSFVVQTAYDPGHPRLPPTAEDFAQHQSGPSRPWLSPGLVASWSIGSRNRGGLKKGLKEKQTTDAFPLPMPTHGPGSRTKSKFHFHPPFAPN